MRFEYDPEKSISNAQKHGIDFEKAQELWLDDNILEIQVAFEGEPRSIVIGRISDKCWTVVITYRDGVVRIISARRSRKKEVYLYGQEN